MKVLMLSSSISRRSGGIGIAVMGLSSSLADVGLTVKVCASHDEYTDADTENWNGGKISLFPVVGPRAFGIQRGLWEFIKSERPDVIHLHGLWMYPSFLLGRLLQSSIPRVVSPHGMLDPWALRNSIWKKRVARVMFENANLRRATVFHALCEAERNSLLALGFRSPVHVIPNGIDLPDANDSSAPPSWTDRVPPDSKILLFLGRIHSKKGLEDLIEAFSSVENGLIENPWHIVIAGWDQQGEELRLKNLTARLGLQGRIHFVGPQFGQAKAASLRAADAFVLPSKSEGLPMSVLEAWSHSLPVLMTEACNIPRGFETGAAVNLGSSLDQLKAGIKEFFCLSEERQRDIGAEGYKLAQSEFSWRYVAERMEGLYYCAQRGS